MRSFSDLIANSHRPHEEDRPVNPMGALLFVAVLVIGAAGLAYWIGDSMAGDAAAAVPVLVDLEF